METLFRPSDVAIGPDGALYISDWIDARVGGHSDLDATTSGAIYRVAPKGFVSKIPAFDANTIEGLITALRSPAVNVRAIGFEGLKARGAAAVSAVAALLNDPNPFMRGRALYLLYQLGPEGRQRAGTPESQSDPAMKIAAYRAMRRGGMDILPVAARLARDADAGVRREVALSLRDKPADAALPHPRGHRARLRRPGSQLPRGAGHRRDQEGSRALRAAAARPRACPPIPWRGPKAFAGMAWRLHPPAAVPAFAARARSAKLSMAERRQATRRDRLHRRTAGRGRDAQDRARKGRAGRAGDVVAAEPDVQHLDEPQPRSRR